LLQRQPRLAEWLRKDRIYTRQDDGTIVANDRLWNPLVH
jgi:hypothetical protein